MGYGPNGSGSGGKNWWCLLNQFASWLLILPFFGGLLFYVCVDNNKKRVFLMNCKSSCLVNKVMSVLVCNLSFTNYYIYFLEGVFLSTRYVSIFFSFYYSF